MALPSPEPRLCSAMLEAYSSGPGAPLPFPHSGLTSTAADDADCPVAKFVLLDLTAAADDDMALAHACKALSVRLRSIVDDVILIGESAARRLDALEPWFIYLNPLLRLRVLSSAAELLASSVATHSIDGSSVCLVVATTVERESVVAAMGFSGEPSHRVPGGAELVSMASAPSSPSSVLESVATSDAVLLQYDPVRGRADTSAGWSSLAPWVEDHCPRTCRFRRSACTARDVLWPCAASLSRARAGVCVRSRTHNFTN